MSKRIEDPISPEMQAAYRSDMEAIVAGIRPAFTPEQRAEVRDIVLDVLQAIEESEAYQRRVTWSRARQRLMSPEELDAFGMRVAGLEPRDAI